MIDPGLRILPWSSDSEGQCVTPLCESSGYRPLKRRLTSCDRSLNAGAGGEDRTPDLRFTKPLHYRCATPAGALKPLRKLAVSARQERL